MDKTDLSFKPISRDETSETENTSQNSYSYNVQQGGPKSSPQSLPSSHVDDGDSSQGSATETKAHVTVNSILSERGNLIAFMRATLINKKREPEEICFCL